MKRWQSLASILTDPEPLQPKERPIRLVWPISAQYNCPPVIPPLPETFIETVERRRSRRVILSASLRETVNVLGYTLAPRFQNKSGQFQGLNISSGALQAVDILMIVGCRVFRYDRVKHSVQSVRIKNPTFIKCFLARCNTVLPSASGIFLAFIGDISFISTYYDNPETLMFRDAGALLQTLAFVCTAYRLGFCPMGLLGSEVVDGVGLNLNKAMPLATAAIGRY